MEIKRLSTGISGLDSLLKGGFLPNRSYLVTGEAGTGKTTACMQFLLAGLEQGEKAVYVTVDERPADILQSAASLDWDLQHHVQAKSLVILDASPYFSGRANSNGDKGGDLQKIVTDLAAYAKRMEAARLVIDPISPLIASGDSPGRVHDLARAFVHLVQSNLTTTNLFTSHLPRRANSDLTNGIEEFLAAGVFVLKVNRVDGQSMRTLQIKKMRGAYVHEVPVKPRNLHRRIVLRREAAAPRHPDNHAHQDDTDDHVERVHARHYEIEDEEELACAANGSVNSKDGPGMWCSTYLWWYSYDS